MPIVASSVFPVPDRYIDYGKEPAGQPGTTASAVTTFPMTTFKPEDKVTYLEDSAWRNAMAMLYNLVQGVEIAEVSTGGPFFGDTVPIAFASVLGDYFQSVVGGVTGTVSSVSGTVTSGATTVTLASGTISANAVISIGTPGSLFEEVRKVVSNSNGTLTLNAALYQTHSSSAQGTIISYTSYTGIAHNFALLNSGTGMGGYTQSQPPTYTLYDTFGVPGGSGAWQYNYACFSEVTLSCDASQLVMWDGKLTAFASQLVTGSAPVVSISGVVPQAGWNSTVTIAGAGTYDTSDWKVTITRKLAPKFTNSGQQTPFAIARGGLSAALDFTFDPASDQAQYNYMRSNTQPTVVLTANNGLAGTAAVILTVTANQCAFDTSVLDDSKDVFGWTNTAKLVANTTNIGPSGGFGPLVLTVQNQTINY